MPPAQKGLAGVAVASANNVGNPTTLAPALPVHAVGDLLLCYTACRSATPTVACAGWTQLANVAGTNGRLALFGKIATSASETAPSVVWSGMTTGTSGTPAQAQCAVFTGTQLSADIVGTVENVASSTTVAASGTPVTTLTADDLILTMSVRSDDVGTWTMPAGFTRIGDALTTSGADMSFGWAYQIQAVPGSSAPADFSVPSAVAVNSSGIQVALKEILPVTYFGAISLPVTYGQTINGIRKTFSSLGLPVTFDAVVDGQVSTPAVTYYGACSLPVLFDVNSDGQRKTFGQLLSPLIFGKAVAGRKTTFGQVAFPINVAIATAGLRAGLTLYGAVALPITFGKDIRGQRKAFGQVALPLTFTKDVRGQRKTFGQIAFPIIFTKEAVGRKNVFGQLSMQTLFSKETVGRRRTFSQLAMPITFSKIVAGRKQTFGKVALPVNATIVVNGFAFTGPKTYYGQLAFPIVFSKQVVAQRKTFGQITAPFLFGAALQGKRRTFSNLQLPIDFEVAVKSGRVGVHSALRLELILIINTTGNIKLLGVILNDALNLYLGEQNVVAAYVGSEKVWP